MGFISQIKCLHLISTTTKDDRSTKYLVGKEKNFEKIRNLADKKKFCYKITSIPVLAFPF